MKSMSVLLSLSKTSSFLPCQASRPSESRHILSPICITLFISWVLMIVVMLLSLVILLIRSSIVIAVLGSSQEFGSSQKRYFGFSTIALAIPTRFCIPPLISEGYLSLIPAKFTLSRQ